MICKMKCVVLIVLALCSLSSMISGQTISAGECREPSVAVNFQINNFVGLWFEVYTTTQEDEEGLECMTVIYSNDEGDSFAQIANTGVREQEVFNTQGSLTKDDEENTEAKFTITYDEEGQAIPYWIIRTDYVGYAVVYSCTQVDDNVRSELVWVLSRDTYLPAAGLDLIYNDISNLGGWTNIRAVSHKPDSCDSGAMSMSITLALIGLSTLISKLL